MASIADTFAVAFENHQAGKLPMAERLYQQILQADPRHAGAHNMLGALAYQTGRFEHAVMSFRQALSLNPGAAEYHSNLGLAYTALGQTPEAVASLRQALALRPDFAEAYNNLANALMSQGKWEETASLCRQALQFRPDFPEAHYNLAIALRDLGKLEDAVDSFQRAIHFRRDFPEAYTNLGDVYLKLGLPELALESFQEALRLKPNLGPALRNVLFQSNYDPKADIDAIFAEHRRWGEMQEAAYRSERDANVMAWSGDHAKAAKDPNRRLRIGYVSPDFRLHALARYLEPVLANHDPKQVEVFCYAEVQIPDAVTARLRSLAHHWFSTCHLNDTQVAERIRRDRIDILIDLAGHTCNSRLSVFALKPAPVQATWLGYLNTTGLKSVDYRLTDEVLDPPNQPIRDTEELVRLPAGMSCFAPPADAPGLTPLPAEPQGQLTFGSTHNLFKLNSAVFDLWAKVLSAVPSARLLMFRDALTSSVRQRIQRQFAERGIGEERLDLRQGSNAPGYLKVFEEIDVSLDTFPCTGGVTTCESLWMGVPVLSLRGTRPAGRNSAAILTRVGLGDWAVDTPEEYVALAERLPNDLYRLSEIRAGLRDRMLATVCDGKTFTRVLENAYRAWWRRW